MKLSAFSEAAKIDSNEFSEVGLSRVDEVIKQPVLAQHFNKIATSNQKTFCEKNWEREVVPAYDELKKELLCSRDRIGELCKLLMFPEKHQNFDSTVVDRSSNPKTSRRDKNQAEMVPASSVQSVRALNPAMKKLEAYGHIDPLRAVEDFYRHTQLHKQRMIRLTLLNYDTNPDEFAGLTREQVKRAVEIHDNEKLEAISRYGKPNYEELYEGVGHKIDRTTIIDPLNKVGDENLKKLFKEIGLADSPKLSSQERRRRGLQRKVLKDQLLLPDETDRMYDPVTRKAEYLGQKVYPRNNKYNKLYPKSSAFYDAVNVETGKLEYYQYVKGLEFKSLTSSERYQLIKQIRSSEINAFKAGKINASYAMDSYLDLYLRGNFYRGASFLAKPAVQGSLLALDLAIYPIETGCSDYSAGFFSVYEKKDGQCQLQVGHSNPQLQKFLLTPLERTEKEISKKETLGTIDAHEILSYKQSCDFFIQAKNNIDQEIQSLSCDSNRTLGFHLKNSNEIIRVEFDEDNIKKININEGSIGGKQSFYEFENSKVSNSCIYHNTMLRPCVLPINNNFYKSIAGKRARERLKTVEVNYAYEVRSRLSYHIYKAIRQCQKTSYVESKTNLASQHP